MTANLVEFETTELKNENSLLLRVFVCALCCAVPFFMAFAERPNVVFLLRTITAGRIMVLWGMRMFRRQT